MSPDDPAKRVPQTLSTDPKLLGPYTLADAGVALGPAVLVVLALQVILPAEGSIGGVTASSLTLPLAGVAIAIGAAIVALTPAHLRSHDWLRLLLRFSRGARYRVLGDAAAPTRLRRVHTSENCLERTDGALVAMLRVDPPAMALATEAQWRRAAAAFEDLCNTVVDAPVQFYATTRPFPIDAYLTRFWDRLDDPDLQENPRLVRVCHGYLAWFAADLDARRMTIRDHYVIVSVTPAEVDVEHTPVIEALAALPLVGRFVPSPRSAAARAALVETLEDRCRRIEAGLLEIEGCTSSRVSATEAAALLASFWRGEPVAQSDIDARLRDRPFVTRSR